MGLVQILLAIGECDCSYESGGGWTGLDVALTYIRGPVIRVEERGGAKAR